MARKQSYLDQAYDYYRQQAWRQQLLAMRVPRSLVVKAGTLAALGRASALAQILAACTQAGSKESTGIGTTAEGAYQYSKYPMIDKYNWRKLPWGGTPFVDGTLQMTGSGSRSWDFVHISIASQGQIMDNLLNKRYGAGADMEQDELEGHLADKWSHAPDFSYFDYHVRRDVYFHDLPPVNGRLCTAEDVKYCLDVYRTQGLAKAALGFIERIEVLTDKETVRVHLVRPVLFLDVTLASNDFYIFAREHFEGPKERWEQQPIGIGPFKMTYQAFGDRMETVRHEQFSRRDDRWQGYQLPFLKAWNTFVVAEGVGTKAALRAGQIDYLQISDYVDLQDLLGTNPEMTVQVTGRQSTYGSPWVLNLRDPLFQDIRVRRALNLALDRRQMIDTLAGGLANGAHTISWTWLGLSDPLTTDELGPWQQYDPAKARALLAQAGYPNGFEMEYMVSGSPTNANVVMQQYLQQIGVRVNFNQVESVVLTAARTNKTFKHSIIGTPSTGYDAVKVAREWFLPDSPRNWGGVDDPEMTDLVNQLTYTVDVDEQRRLLWQIHERSLDQSYSLATYNVFAMYLGQPWLHNVASAVQGQFNAYGYHQINVAWIDDKAPEGRKGRLKA